MIHETFSVTAYDGYAKYEVTEDFGDGTVQIESVRENEYDYTAPLLGESCRISKANVQEVIDYDKRWLR